MRAPRRPKNRHRVRSALEGRRDRVEDLAAFGRKLHETEEFKLSPGPQFDYVSTAPAPSGSTDPRRSNLASLEKTLFKQQIGPSMGVDLTQN